MNSLRFLTVKAGVTGYLDEGIVGSSIQNIWMQHSNKEEGRGRALPQPLLLHTLKGREAAVLSYWVHVCKP